MLPWQIPISMSCWNSGSCSKNNNHKYSHNIVEYIVINIVYPHLSKRIKLNVRANTWAFIWHCLEARERAFCAGSANRWGCRAIKSVVGSIAGIRPEVAEKWSLEVLLSACFTDSQHWSRRGDRSVVPHFHDISANIRISSCPPWGHCVELTYS